MLTLGGLFAGSLCPCCSPTLFLAPQVLYLAQDGQEQVVLPKAAILDGVSILEFAYPNFLIATRCFTDLSFTCCRPSPLCEGDSILACSDCFRLNSRSVKFIGEPSNYTATVAPLLFRRTVSCFVPRTPVLSNVETS